MYGIQILSTYLPYGTYQAPINPHDWYSPNFFYADYLDALNRNINIGAVKEIQILQEDAGLLSFDDVVACIEKRIAQGKLKSVYTIKLAYSFKLVKGDTFWNAGNTDFNPDTRFVLVPEWQILGFDEKDARAAKSVGLDEPSKETILDPENHSRYQIGYEVRMDAATGKFILDYEAQEFALTK